MKETKTFQVRGLTGSTRELDKKLAELQAGGWTIQYIRESTSPNPYFYVVAERGGEALPSVAGGEVSGEIGTLVQNVVWVRDDLGELKRKMDEIIKLLTELRNK